MSRTLLHIFSIIFIMLVCMWLFYAFPSLDLYISQFVYSSLHNQFPYAHHGGVLFIYRYNFVAYLVIPCFLLFYIFTGNRAYLQAFLLLAGTALLANGLIINIMLKNNLLGIGRARPLSILDFGGTHSYTPPFFFSSACPTNCSFPSGHASSGFLFLALGFVPLWHRYRFWFFSLGLILGCVAGLGRILQGGHFFSDVLFTALFVLLVAYALSIPLAFFEKRYQK